uniref:Photosynthesis system II assembly factor Ycf48/Hcf136-like domain-containing protein n=1 Tax=candidate division WOR-3 bacterium TaxID=2052148 RepID=A0A7C6E9X3_UNCW3
MKNLFTMLVIALLILAGNTIAQEEPEMDYETDGTLTVDSPDDGRALNGIFAYTEGNYACFWIVGDSGLVLRYRGEDGHGYPDAKSLNRYTGHDSLLDPTHNLMSVSFATLNIGWIVGYVNGGTDKWKGVIWKTTDGGQTWAVQYPDIAPGEKIPCLKVQALDERVVWVSCGNGYVLKTTDGGATWNVYKPGGDRHTGWLWGVWAYDTTTAWVCSDQSGYVANKNYWK